jgi:ABC-2 type transport system permease protein
LDAEARFTALAAEPFRGRRNGGPTESAIGAVGQVAEIVRSRHALGLLVRRDLKARYKDSTLGFLWTLARPLTQLAIYVIVIGYFLNAAHGIPGFAIYVYTGIAAFTLFSDIVSGGTGSIIANAGLVKKVSVPRELYPLASVGGAIFNYAIQLVILLAATLALGVFPLGWDLLYAIPGILIILLYGTALAILLSAVTVYLRDISYLMDVLLMVLMWMSPVLYSWSMVRDALTSLPGGSVWIEIYTNNPLTLAVLSLQKALWKDGVDAVYPDYLLLRLGIAIVIGFIALVVGHWVFRRIQGNFAQEL